MPEALRTPAQLTHFKVMLNDYLDQRMRFFKHFYFKPGRNRLLTDSFIQKHLVNVKAASTENAEMNAAGAGPALRGL